MRLLKKQKKIMLIITENCNLRCTYCYEQEKRGNTMDFETAAGILDRAFSDMEGFESMVIELHGGEPFINFSLIKKIDEYVMKKYSQWPILFRMISNGTLVHGEIQEWLKERKDRFEVMLSLDGIKLIHDRNRKFVSGKGSFDSIDLEFFYTTWKNCPVSMTVNEACLSELSNGTIWIEKMGFDCLNAFEWAATWDISRCLPILVQELEKLKDYYIENEEQKPCLLLRYNLLQFYRPFGSDYRYCVEIGDPLECYDARGKFAPCHGFTEFTVGSEKEAEKFKNFTIHDFVFTDENICKDCLLKRLCRICFAANQMEYGNMQIQDPAICTFNQLCILYGIKIWKGRLTKKDSLSKQEYEILRAARDIENYILSREDLKCIGDQL